MIKAGVRGAAVWVQHSGIRTADSVTRADQPGLQQLARLGQRPETVPSFQPIPRGFAFVMPSRQHNTNGARNFAASRWTSASISCCNRAGCFADRRWLRPVRSLDSRTPDGVTRFVGFHGVR